MKRILAMKVLMMRAFPDLSAAEIQGALDAFSLGIADNLQRAEDFSPEQVAALHYLDEEIGIEEHFDLIAGSPPNPEALEGVSMYLYEVVAAWRRERGHTAN